MSVVNVFTKLFSERIKYFSYAISTLLFLPLWAYLIPTELDDKLLPLSLLIHTIFLALCFWQKLELKFWLGFNFLVHALYYLSKLYYVFSTGVLEQNPSTLMVLFLPWGLFLFMWLQLIFSGRYVRSLNFSIIFYLAILSISLVNTFNFTNPIMSVTDEPLLGMFLSLSFFNLLFSNMLAWLLSKEGKVYENIPVTYDALHDPLTLLPNRMSFLSQLSKALRLRQSKHRIAVFLIDLDQLKPINDNLGHLVGDEVLRQVAQRLENSLLYKDRGVLSRLGGDEYAAFLKGLKHIDEATKQAQTMVESLQSPFEIAGQSLSVTASVGLSFAPDHGNDNQSLLSKADKAMYHVKALGKNDYRLFSPEMDRDTAERLALKQRFREAFKNETLKLHYQPMIELVNERVAYFEVLLRWNDKEYGQVPPKEFIPLAEETGLMIPLGKWVLKKACSSCRVWQRAGYSDIGVSVNISTSQLMQADFANFVVEVLQETQLKSKHLLLEIAESSVLQPRAQEELRKIKLLGVKVSLDDFGTGYASFAQLKQLEVSHIKIDNSFIVKLGDTKISSYSTNFVRTVIQFCKSQGIIVVAEGIETQTHLNLLRQSSCDQGQGNFISMPLPFKSLRGFLENPRFVPRLPDEFASLTLNKLNRLLNQTSD